MTIKQNLIKRIRNRDLNGVQAALDQGASVNSTDDEGATLLHHAVREQLLRRAIYKQEYLIISLLLRCGADMDRRDVHGKTAEDYAQEHLQGLKEKWNIGYYDECRSQDPHVWEEAKRIVQALREERSLRIVAETDPTLGISDCKGRTWLHRAAEANDREAVERWIQAEGEVDARDLYGHTAAMLAARNGCADALEPLLDCMNGWYLQTNIYTKDNLAHMAVRSNDLATVEVLDRKAAQERETSDLFTACDQQGKTPLHYTVYADKNAAAMAKILIRQGADPDKKNPEGHSALGLAIAIGSVEECVQMIPASKRIADEREGRELLKMAIASEPTRLGFIEEILHAHPHLGMPHPPHGITPETVAKLISPFRLLNDEQKQTRDRILSCMEDAAQRAEASAAPPTAP